jgi:hypothetical protein
MAIKQWAVRNSYEGIGYVIDALDEYRRRKGLWATSYKELYEAGMLPTSYTYPVSGGRRVQAVSSGFANIKLVRSSGRQATYDIELLGNRFDNTTVKLDKE